MINRKFESLDEMREELKDIASKYASTCSFFMESYSDIGESRLVRLTAEQLAGLEEIDGIVYAEGPNRNPVVIISNTRVTYTCEQCE